MIERRKFESRRPSGTDGSDFSYRMVVDSRYQKVAKKKKTLSSLIFIQAIFQFVGLPYIFLSATRGESLDVLAVSSVVVSFISLIIGELGRRRSRVNFLRIYIVGSSIAILLFLSAVIRSNSTWGVIKNGSESETTIKVQETFSFAVGKFEAQETFRVAVGLLVHIFMVSSVSSVISNMSPPKRAS